MTQKNLSVNRTKEVLIKNTHEYTCTHMYTHEYTNTHLNQKILQKFATKIKLIRKPLRTKKNESGFFKNIFYCKYLVFCTLLLLFLY